MPTTEHTSITFANHFGWLPLSIGCVVLAVLLWQTHRWMIAPLPRRRRWTLITLRLGWSIILLWCIAQPTLRMVSRSESTVTPHVVVMVDGSASMNTPSGKSAGSWRAVQRAADDLKSRLTAAGVTDATWLSFGSRLRPYTTEAKPDDTQSLVVSNLRDAINQESRDTSPTVMFLITDGQDTAQTPPADALAAANGRDLRILPIVPDGLLITPPPMVRVERVAAPQDVATGSAFDIQADVRVRQHDADRVPPQVVLERDGKAIATKPLAAAGDATVQTSFAATAEKDGQSLYTVRVMAGGKELSHLSTVVRASARQTVRVLYVQGSLDWEYKFVRQAVEDNPNIVLDAITRMNGAAFLRQTNAAAPTRVASDALAAVKTAGTGYDVIVLSNINPELLDNDLQKSLLDLVQKRGGGILFFSGNAAQAAQFNGTLLEQLLPVTLESSSSAPVAEDVESRKFSEFMASPESRGNGFTNEENFAAGRVERGPILGDLLALRLTPDGIASDIFADPTKGGSINAQPKPPATFRFSAKARRGKPAATVLAVHPTEVNIDHVARPLFAVENIASGRSAFLGIDGLWRWRMSSPSTARDYDRFWQQLFLWLGGRVQQSMIEFDQGRYHPGQVIHTRLRLPSAAKAGEMPELSVRDSSGADQNVPLTWNTARTEAAGDFTPSAEGELQFTARPPAGQDGSTLAVQVVSVRTTNLEEEFCGLNEPLLQQIARATHGQVLRTGDMDLVSSLVKTARQSLEHVEQAPLWHYPWVFVVMILLYSAELVLRRIYQLT